MATPSAHRPKNLLPLFIAVCLVSLNLRMTITGVGPLLDEIALEQRVSPALLGALATMPLITWGLFSPFAQSIADRIGLDRAVSWALVIFTVASIVRALPGSPVNVWLGAVMIGFALAVGNALIPAAIKRDFGKHVPLMMGVYSALLGLAGAIGAGMVSPISHFELSDGTSPGWHWALLATGATAPFALIAWLWATRGNPKGPTLAASDERTGLSKRVWKDPVAWGIAFYMGFQSWSFYTYATWVAPISISRGTDPVTAGFHVMLLQGTGILSALLTPFIARGPMRRLLPVIIPFTNMIGATGIIFAPSLLPLWLVISGFSCGVALSVALTYVTQRTSDARTAGAVSGMSQSFGYLIAGLGPVAFGWVYQISGGWGAPLLVLAFGFLMQFAAGVWLWHDRMALPRRGASA